MMSVVTQRDGERIYNNIDMKLSLNCLMYTHKVMIVARDPFVLLNAIRQNVKTHQYNRRRFYRPIDY